MIQKSGKVNVILITIDSLRSDFIGCLSTENGRLTPNLDQLAKESTVFKNVITQAPATRASFPAIFTGFYPSSSWAPNGALGNKTSLVEILKNEGYRTGGFHSNPFLSSQFGYNRGFDIFEDNLLPWRIKGRANISPNLLLKANKFFRLVRKQPYLSAKSITNKTLSWLNQAPEPFFMWIHYMDAHGPYQSKRGFTYLNKFRAEKLWHKAIRKPEEITEKERQLLIRWHSEEVAYIDHYLGVLFDELDKLSLWEQTSVIVTADHGDGFGEHGYYSHPSDKLYDESLKVPLLIKYPNQDKKGSILRDQARLIDLKPTILDLLSIDCEEENMDGKSLMPLIVNDVHKSNPEFAISQAIFNPEERSIELFSIRTNDWKYILNISTDHAELYNLNDDPSEKNNIVNDRIKVAKSLRAKLNEHINDISNREETFGPHEKVKIDEEVKARLRNLGYID